MESCWCRYYAIINSFSYQFLKCIEDFVIFFSRIYSWVDNADEFDAI